jgi:hypothetical protein
MPHKPMARRIGSSGALFASFVFAGLTACGGGATNIPGAPSGNVAAAPASAVAQPSAQSTPPTAKNASSGGFSGDRAFDHVAKLVAFGPHPPATDAIHRVQEYILAQLNGFGCKVETDDFHASTPVGSLLMKNIVVKIPGTGSNIILLATHYDTDMLDQNDKKMTDFVGADDAGSSTGLMLEMARVLCGKPQPSNIWIAFLDGEEALQHWDNDTDSVFGSKELAARLSLSGDLPHVKAFVLADLVGGKKLRIKREDNSTPWLAEIVWSTAARLGHQDIFVSEKSGGIEDDHLPFKNRKVPVVDIIDLDTTNDVPYWHTPQDTLDKVSPHSLQVVGDVILASLPEIAKHPH